MLHEQLKDAILKSQHCQRNWDLSKEIPQEDMDLILFAATNCPSKQNIAFYKLHAITNRERIEAIHAKTTGFGWNGEQTNTQTLANLLLIFERFDDINSSLYNRNVHVREVLDSAQRAEDNFSLEIDRQQAVGVAAGYVNMTASMLGYSTGCCRCMDHDGVKQAAGLERQPLLLMGVGFKDPERNRRVHQKDPTYVFPTYKKQEIPVNLVG